MFQKLSLDWRETPAWFLPFRSWDFSRERTIRFCLRRRGSHSGPTRYPGPERTQRTIPNNPTIIGLVGAHQRLLEQISSCSVLARIRVWSWSTFYLPRVVKFFGSWSRRAFAALMSFRPGSISQLAMSLQTPGSQR